MMDSVKNPQITDELIRCGYVAAWELEFTSDESKMLLKDLHVRESMDGKSQWADNIMIERWFRSLKIEYINEFWFPRALRTGIAEYVHSYNTIRPHEAWD